MDATFIPAHASLARSVPKPALFQDWASLTFLHWKYNPAIIERLLPPGLHVDTYEDSAWLGVILFRVERFHFRGLPAIPGTSSFSEIALRTYVRGVMGERAVWYLRLEANALAAVVSAMFGLPGHWSTIDTRLRGELVEYKSRLGDISVDTRCRATIRIGEQIMPGEREVFLTSRYRLYTQKADELASVDIEHPSWRLRAADLLYLDDNIFESCGLPRPREVPLVHYSPGVHARIGYPVLRSRPSH